MLYEDYDKENWESLVTEEGATEKGITKKIDDGENALFGPHQKVLMEDLFSLSGPNIFGGTGVVKKAYIKETSDVLKKDIKLLVLKVSFEDNYPGYSSEYHVDCPVVINVGSGSTFLKLANSIKNAKSSERLSDIVGKIIEEGVDFEGRQYNLVQTDLDALLYQLCNAILGHRVHVDGRIAYDCQNHQQAFFVESITFE
ncbi:hypothetical protein JZO77_13470 [Enterococcus hulanensis]|uniref:hypothetical protein n=1 Tax=Enterococcus hulanensis TaxID=2559929 RepID=UPI001A8EE729|nr:hypothetical protein [Enterococcus hulanensis]MBO0457744.1 hypothetical protein [Enterococcus hulanensis]